MEFTHWLYLQEANLTGLYADTVRAFPKTTKRQHAIDEIVVKQMEWTPYKGVKTLMVRGLAKNEGNGKEYKPLVLFKKVKYHDSKENRNWTEIVASDGRKYVFEKLNDQNEVLVRCDCMDFRYRWNYEDSLRKALYGRVRSKYEAKVNPGSSNPLELPGMCKHIIKLVNSLGHAGILED